MATARLHDGSTIEVTVRGDGPAILLPVRTTLIEGEAAEQMRAWGAEPNAGHDLAAGLTGHRVITADYEGHRAAHPAAATLTAEAVAHDLLAIADAAGAARFDYYGYSWLALAGLQLAIRTDRLTGLAMGGYPPLGGPYDAMLAVTRSAHRQALENQADPPAPKEVVPGDWDSAELTATPEQTGQYVTLYESLQGFDESAVELTIPRLAFAGADDVIEYGARWDHARVEIGPALARNQDELERKGWIVRIIDNADHMSAMHAPVVREWLRGRR
ncbi:alpha/beta hydrolase [Actinoplanes sp. NPDC051411]|uniref:alpha/beta hydrolase n=1 Tax=Actinoplanes sp. NPDC051411 TaxID=3155522 RepID=UPI00343B0D9C